MKLTYTLQEIPSIAKKILAVTTSKNILFYGDMGAGKTTLIKALAKEIGVKDSLSSPTFSIVNEYQADNGLLYHFDFYRIDKEEEAYDMGIEEYFYSNHYNFIEWPEKINGLLPEVYDTVLIQKNENGSRTLNIAPVS